VRPAGTGCGAVGGAEALIMVGVIVGWGRGAGADAVVGRSRNGDLGWRAGPRVSRADPAQGRRAALGRAGLGGARPISQSTWGRVHGRGPSRAESSRAESSRAESSRAESSRGRSHRVRSRRVRSRRVRSRRVRSRRGRSRRVRSRRVRSRRGRSRRVRSRRGRSRRGRSRRGSVPPGPGLRAPARAMIAGSGRGTGRGAVGCPETLIMVGVITVWGRGAAADAVARPETVISGDRHAAPRVLRTDIARDRRSAAPISLPGAGARPRPRARVAPGQGRAGPGPRRGRSRGGSRGGPPGVDRPRLRVPRNAVLSPPTLPHHPAPAASPCAFRGTRSSPRAAEYG
jgi:hypothetical protein